MVGASPYFLMLLESHIRLELIDRVLVVEHSQVSSTDRVTSKVLISALAAVWTRRLP